MADSDRLAALAGGLLELAHADDSPETAREPVDVDEVLASVAHDLRHAAQSQDRRLEARPSGYVVHGDQLAIQRAVRNMTDNALVHGRGTITLGADVAPEQRGVTLWVRDEGRLDDALGSGQAFERFVRGADAVGRPGAGLGLSLVEAVARNHGGSAVLESDPRRRRARRALPARIAPRRETLIAFRFHSGPRDPLVTARDTAVEMVGECADSSPLSAAAVALAAALVAGAPASAHRPRPQAAQHVLLISVDGLHQSDLDWYVANHPTSTLAQMAGAGVDFTSASTPIPSDSFPGLTALVTGGNPASTGIYYDDSYNRALLPAGTTSCAGVAAGTEVTYFRGPRQEPAGARRRPGPAGGCPTASSR